MELEKSLKIKAAIYDEIAKIGRLRNEIAQELSVSEAE